MAVCTKCGATLSPGVVFCGSCGTPVQNAASAPPPAAGAPTATAGGGMEQNVAGMLAYILGFITGIIFLVIDPYKNNKFVRFHAFQSIFFNVALIVFWIAFGIVTSILGYVSLGILAILMGFIGLLLWLAIFLFWLFLMFKAYKNEQFMIPFIGPLAAKQAG